MAEPPQRELFSPDAAPKDAIAINAMVSLIEQGWADQIDVARAFGRDERSVRRYQRRFEDGGLAALGRSDGYPLGRPRTDRTRERRVSRLRSEGKSLRQIADVIGGRRRRRAALAPGADPNLSGSATAAAAEPLVVSADRDPADRWADRWIDRLLANAVLPSIIDTPANRAAMPSADHAAWPKPAELAEGIGFLASPHNALTSGALVPVYGQA